MDHSDEDIAIQTSMSEETISLVPSFSETFRTDDELLGYYQVDLEQLRAFCLAPNGLISPEWRKLGWPKLVGAHVEIWKAAAKLTPLDESNDGNDVTTANITHLHHPSKDEISYIKQVVASCEWESVGILKKDPIVMPVYNPERQNQPSPKQEEPSKPERRVSFHLPELAFSTKRQKDRKTLRKVLIHLKRTNPNFAMTSATCSAVAMVLSILQSSSLSTLMVQQLVSFPWKYCREWPRSNNVWELDDRWQHLFTSLLSPELRQHFESNGMEILEGTIRYSWIPSWLSQNIPNKDILARIWDVLIPSKPDAILYVCLSLLSYFEEEFLSETGVANNPRLVVLELPAKLDSVEKVEAVLSQAMKWMTQHQQQSPEKEEEAEMMPSWVSATVAPGDSGIVEYARHLRETVTKEGKSLRISKKNIGSADMKANEASAWFCLEGSDSPFVMALKAKSLSRTKEYNATASSKSSWVLVLFILLPAVAVIVGLETDCSVLLRTNPSSTARSNNCLHQISDLYWDDIRNQVSKLQRMGYNQRDEIQKVWSALKQPTTDADASIKSSDSGSDLESSKIPDVVMSPSENVHGDDQVHQGELKEETPPQLELLKEPTHDPENFDELESYEKEEEEGNEWQGNVESEAPELRQKEPAESDDPVQRSHEAAERLVQETLHQTEAASKLAESIVSHFMEEAEAALGKVEERIAQDSPAIEPELTAQEDIISEAIDESHDIHQSEASNDIHYDGAQTESNNAHSDLLSSAESYSSDKHEDYPTEEEVEESNTRETELTTAEGDRPEEDNGIPEENNDVPPERVPEVLNDEDHQAFSHPIEDPVSTGDIVGGDENVDDEINENVAGPPEQDVSDQDAGAFNCDDHQTLNALIEDPVDAEDMVGANERSENEEKETPIIPPEHDIASDQAEESFKDGDHQLLGDLIEGPVDKGDIVGADDDLGNAVNEMPVVPPEQDTAPIQVTEAFNDDSIPIEDPVDAEDTVGTNEDLEDEVQEMLPKETHSFDQANPDTVRSTVETEEIETESPEENDIVHRSEDLGEVSRDHQYGRDEEPKQKPQHMDRYSADESLDDRPAGDKSNSNEKTEENNDDALRLEPKEQIGDGGVPTVLEIPHGLFSRNVGYSSSDPHLEIIHLSKPFFSKDDVAAVFEQLMAASIDVPMHKLYKKVHN